MSTSFVCKKRTPFLSANLLVGCRRRWIVVFCVPVTSASRCLVPIEVVGWRSFTAPIILLLLTFPTRRAILLPLSFRARTQLLHSATCNVYGLNKACEGSVFFESLYPVLDPQLPCVLCGDFNTVVDPSKDRRGCNIFSPSAYNWSANLT